jgi:hypothetical protein
MSEATLLERLKNSRLPEDIKILLRDIILEIGDIADRVTVLEDAE